LAGDPYQELGVARGASAEEIRKAFRKLAKQLHPDQNPGDKPAEERFKRVSAAFDILVELLALLFVAQDVEGGGDALEALFGGLVVGILVGVVRLGELTEALADLVRGGAFGDAQFDIRILRHGPSESAWFGLRLHLGHAAPDARVIVAKMSL
jgi:curved DNA-binding protein CbpA